jgi:hypothetical protein
MAVKVMVAPAIARGEIDAGPRRAAKEPAPAEKRPRRRKSAVYDAEGNEVFITLMCLKCHKMRPLSQFGLRRMADGAIRNQPWCRTCRSGASPKARRGPVEAVESTVPADSPAPAPPSPRPAADAGLIAAQVAAALHNGRG